VPASFLSSSQSRPCTFRGHVCTFAMPHLCPSAAFSKSPSYFEPSSKPRPYWLLNILDRRQQPLVLLPSLFAWLIFSLLFSDVPIEYSAYNLPLNSWSPPTNDWCSWIQVWSHRYSILGGGFCGPLGWF
jgi:hypothetical protein